jgi:hypothetical protein
MVKQDLQVEIPRRFPSNPENQNWPKELLGWESLALVVVARLRESNNRFAK